MTEWPKAGGQQPCRSQIVPTQSAGDRFREAAAVLRKRAADATSGPWISGFGTQYVFGATPGDEVAGRIRPADAAYIALMSPPVAQALAIWFEGEAWAADLLDDQGRKPYMRGGPADLVADALLRPLGGDAL
jgi:hypothetical protein